MNSSQPQNRLIISLLAGEEFCRYRERWNKLLDASISESFFLKWEWIYTYWESLDKENAVLQVWLCHDGNKLVGIAPFYVYSTMYMKIPVRKMAFLGDRVASDYMDIFALPGYEEACCREVLNRVNDQSPEAYDILCSKQQQNKTKYVDDNRCFAETVRATELPDDEQPASS